MFNLKFCEEKDYLHGNLAFVAIEGVVRLTVHRLGPLTAKGSNYATTMHWQIAYDNLIESGDVDITTEKLIEEIDAINTRNIRRRYREEN